MAILVQNQSSSHQPTEKRFNGLRRTKEGMLYLTTIDPNSSKVEIKKSNWFEPGKTDNVDETKSYTTERLSLYNVQYFTGDNSTLSFTLNTTGYATEQLAVFIDNVRQTAFEDYNLSGTTLTFQLKPANNVNITVGIIEKKYLNNDSDRYQQFTFHDNTTTLYLINSSGDLVRRVNHQRTAELISTTDDFDTFEGSTASVNTSTYQSAE